MKKINGFNLIEMLITLSIIGILSATCLPLYSSHITKERRIEAAIILNKLAVALEQFFITHQNYDATLERLGFKTQIADNHYQLAITKATGSEFIIEAQPSAAQAAKDSQCGTLALNSVGEKTITGTGTVNDCW
jgi:type IV pilus assembly protein PilE